MSHAWKSTFPQKPAQEKKYLKARSSGAGDGPDFSLSMGRESQGFEFLD